MTRDEKIDALFKLLLDDIRGHLQKHGETLARIDERTKLHEKRMDRMDKRAAGLGAVTGAVGGALAVLGKSLFGPPGT